MPKHKNRPRRHSRARARLLLRIDTTVLRLTNQLDVLRSIRWDVEHGHDMRTPRARLAEVDGSAQRERLEMAEIELADLLECMDRDGYDPDTCRGGK